MPQWLACVRSASAISAPFAHVPAPVHSRSLVAVGARSSYSFGAHVLACVPQTRSVLAVPFRCSYSPFAHTVHAMHGLMRWVEVAWNVPAGHAAHVRFVFFESAEICSPLPHVGWAVHFACRCPAES